MAGKCVRLTTGPQMLKIQTQKGSNKCVFILTRTHSMHIFREVPFIKPHNNT